LREPILKYVDSYDLNYLGNPPRLPEVVGVSNECERGRGPGSYPDQLFKATCLGIKNVSIEP